MDYTTRIVKSASGLTQHEALLSLQNHSQFQAGTKIASIHNQGGHWVAKLLVPKTSNEDVKPCEHCEDKGCQHCKKTAAGAFEDIDESPADLHDDMHEMNESPLEEMEEHEGEDHVEKHERSEDKKIAELEKKIDLLLDALGISEKGEDMDEMPEGPSADLPAAPASKRPKGPSKSEPLPTGSGAKLKPGEVPNKPGMTPVGSPSFASVKTASCEGECEKGACEHCDSKREANASMPPAAMGAPAMGTASGPVGAPMAGQSCTCPPGQPCSCGASTASNAAAPASPSASGPVMSFTASKADPNRDVSIRMAKAQLENTYQGFRVARIKRDGDYIHALVTR